MTWPQPFEGVHGIDMSNHWLVSLETEAIPHREALISMARALNTATLVGSPAPVVRRIADRIRHPEPGDLVVTMEVLHGRRDPDDREKGLGIYLDGRREWAETDADWQAFCERERSEILANHEDDGDTDDLIETITGEDNRCTDDVFYIQYGPDPRDICRWHNSEAIVLPVQDGPFWADAAAEREDLGGGRQRVTFTRDSLIGGLADSGFRLRGEPGPVPEDGEHLVTVHVPSGAITEVRPVAAARTSRP